MQTISDLVAVQQPLPDRISPVAFNRMAYEIVANLDVDVKLALYNQYKKRANGNAVGYDKWLIHLPNQIAVELRLQTVQKLRNNQG